jgi:imidazolonepropionase-like amidohydrolase
MIKKLFFIFIISTGPFTYLSSEEVIRGIRYLKPNSTFSEASDILIQNGLISRIIESKQKDSIRYAVPSFCDAYVTLGVDSIGGQNSLAGIRLALKSFLAYGFTHIQSIADGPWIKAIKSEIDSGKIVGPRISIANRPLISKSSELADISDLLYYSADNYQFAYKEFQSQIQSTSKNIHIFNRFNNDSSFSFSSEFLNQMREEAKEKNKNLTIHTFGDRIAILDALISGNRYLAHPILFEMQVEIARQHIEELKLIPLLNVYHNMYLSEIAGEEGVSELDFLSNKSKFFQENYATAYQNYLKQDLDENELSTRKLEYSSYLRFIEKNPVLKNKMILGSGAGNRLSFPGVSGIQEMKILSRLFKLDEEFFNIPTKNSCSYLNGSYNGLLAVGEEANLLILKENPLKNLDTLFQIEPVFLNGKLIKLGEPVNKIKRNRK